MGERVKTGIVLFLLYGLLFALSQLVQVVPGLSGLRLQAMLSVPYGLIFGRTGAIAAALGAAAAMAVTGGNPNFIPIEFLGALLSAYLPFRIWQGMRSPQEKNQLKGVVDNLKKSLTSAWKTSGRAPCISS